MKSHLEAKDRASETEPAGAWLLDLLPPEPWEAFLLFKVPVAGILSWQL